MSELIKLLPSVGGWMGVLVRVGELGTRVLLGVGGRAH